MDDKISAVVGKLQQRLGDDYEVRIVDVTKNNDTVKKGISVRKNGEKIGRIYYWNGEALEAFLGDVESSSYFDGNSFEYLVYAVLGGILTCVTCGIATPWAVCMIQRWDVKHQNINNRRLVFSGTGLGFLGEYIIIALLSLITCGIYSSWGQVRLLKYITRHTDFVD